MGKVYSPTPEEKGVIDLPRPHPYAGTVVGTQCASAGRFRIGGRCRRHLDIFINVVVIQIGMTLIRILPK